MDPPPLYPGTEGERAGPGSHAQEAGYLQGKQRLRGDCAGIQQQRTAGAQVPGRVSAQVPRASRRPQPRAGLAHSSSHAQRVLSVGGAVRFISASLGDRPARCPHPAGIPLAEGPAQVSGDAGPLPARSALSAAASMPTPHPHPARAGG